jgi:hypothetical protein
MRAINMRPKQDLPGSTFKKKHSTQCPVKLVQQDSFQISVAGKPIVRDSNLRRFTYFRVVGIGWIMGWSAECPEIESRKGQDSSHLDVIQIGSGAHPASYPIGIGGSFPGGKAAGT